MTFAPLRFAPIFQYRMWGGRKLARWSREPLPGDGPIGEAWILSDRDDHANQVAEGPFKGRTLRQLLIDHPAEMLGGATYPRYPLLLKFLDAAQMLSVQVHPSDAHADLLPPGERGKTEAWLVLDADSESRIYAGLQPGVTAEALRAQSVDGTVEQSLASFHPKPGDALFLEAGTVHALGEGVVVFECQQNSDVTFRLFDWNRVDAKTGQPRELHVDEAIRSTDFSAVAVQPTSAASGAIFDCEFFRVDRIAVQGSATVGAEGELRVLVVLEGEGSLGSPDAEQSLRPGDVYVIPAAVGECAVHGDSVVLAQVAVPRIVD